jgi:hypothetical protein
MNTKKRIEVNRINELFVNVISCCLSSSILFVLTNLVTRTTEEMNNIVADSANPLIAEGINNANVPKNAKRAILNGKANANISIREKFGLNLSILRTEKPSPNENKIIYKIAENSSELIPIS